MAWRLGILCIAGIAWFHDSGRAQPHRLLGNDLGLIFICKQNMPPTTIEDGIESFLRQQGFKVLNQVRLQRERGVFIPFVILIWGLDEQGRIINFDGLPTQKGKYAASLLTRPPTRRSTDLEDAILKLVSEQLGCELTQVARGENQADTEQGYDNHYRIIEGLFQKAERLQGRPPR